MLDVEWPEQQSYAEMIRGLNPSNPRHAALLEDAGPSELGLRVSGHLGCELAAVVLVTERFPKWEHVNVQRGVDAYLAARQSGSSATAQTKTTKRPMCGMYA